MTFSKRRELQMRMDSLSARCVQIEEEIDKLNEELEEKEKEFDKVEQEYSELDDKVLGVCPKTLQIKRFRPSK